VVVPVCVRVLPVSVLVVMLVLCPVAETVPGP